VHNGKSIASPIIAQLTENALTIIDELTAPHIDSDRARMKYVWNSVD